MSGMGVLGREHYGVLSLRGKVENVRDSDVKDSVSPIIQNIMNALGLDFEACYKTAYKLRYGHVMFMMDQVRYVLKVSLASFVGLLLIDMFFLNRMLMEFILKDSYLIYLANIGLRY